MDLFVGACPLALFKDVAARDVPLLVINEFVFLENLLIERALIQTRMTGSSHVSENARLRIVILEEASALRASLDWVKAVLNEGLGLRAA